MFANRRCLIMKIAIVYWSGTGNTQAMANAVAAGAADAGANIRLFEASEFQNNMVNDYEAIAFGCPSMGAEELEDTEFQPMFDSVKTSLANKKIALFGSYGWGDGEWMRTWQEECESLGSTLVSDGLIANEAPDDEALFKCRELGKILVEYVA